MILIKLMMNREQDNIDNVEVGCLNNILFITVEIPKAAYISIDINQPNAIVLI